MASVFSPAGVDVTNYNYLTFWIKSEKPGSLLVSLPEKEWRMWLKTRVDFPANEWTKVRINLNTLGKERFKEQQLRGECFFYPVFPPDSGAEAEMKFLIDKIILE
ncbi:hypothetical protein SDC9_194697 [bioreactor metagenome]|uniref:Uncharacterized protein n=1 Tax=bioreactor metagenome TaxID=1076179 RepID=A0A645I6Y8_9ZZZZ